MNHDDANAPRLSSGFFLTRELRAMRERARGEDAQRARLAEAFGRKGTIDEDLQVEAARRALGGEARPVLGQVGSGGAGAPALFAASDPTEGGGTEGDPPPET